MARQHGTSPTLSALSFSAFITLLLAFALTHLLYVQKIAGIKIMEENMQEYFLTTGTSYVEPNTVDGALTLLHNATGGNFDRLEKQAYYNVGYKNWYINIDRSEFKCETKGLVQPTIANIQLIKDGKVVAYISSENSIWYATNKPNTYATEIYTEHLKITMTVHLNTARCYKSSFKVHSQINE